MDRSVVVVEENNSSGRWTSLGGSRPTHRTSGTKHYRFFFLLLGMG
jgi:hypothetical protein